MAQANARSAARSAAEGSAAAPKGTRQPAPRDEENGSDAQTQGQDADPVVEIPVVVVATNPKRKGSMSYDFFEKYYTAGPKGTLTTLSAVRQAGVRGKDISWDTERRHILVGEEATKFAELETREEQAEYLRSLKVQDKQLIAWGYMDPPAPATETASTEQQTENA